MLHSESTLRSAAPSVGPDELARITEQAVVLGGGTLLELHPIRMGQADLVMRGTVIEQIGGTIPPGLPRIDVSGCIVTPSFVVAHTHGYMALARGMPRPATAPRTLTDHLQSIWWQLDKALDEDLVQTSALVAAASAAKAGATCVVDLHSSPRAIDGSLDLIASALDEVGIRGVLAYETTDREGRGRRDAALKENRRFLERVRRNETDHRALVGAHALMSLNDDTLVELRALADAYAVGIHIHVAEDGTDARDAERKRQTKLHERLHRLGVARRGSILAQASELPVELLPRIAESGAFVVTSPRSNMRHGLHTFRGSGDHVALGTDGYDADILAEVHAYGLLHDGLNDGLAGEAGARIAAGQALGAQLFGDSPGYRLAPGARADLAVIDYDPVTPMSQANVLDHVVRGWTAAHVRHTISGGRFLVRDRVLTTIDEQALAQRARPAAARLWERIQGHV